VYVDKLLRGASAATLPVEQSVPKVYTLNLRASRALGLTVPDWLIRRADAVVR
jgi:putative ABC transport system substrate-binding protein